MSDQLKVTLTPFIFPELTVPRGRLPSDMRAQACWYFYVLAQAAKELVGKSTEDQFGLLEESLWMDKRYEAQARAVVKLYSLESPSEFAKFWPYVRQQAADLGYAIPDDEYVRLDRGRDKATIN
jgi:hypothetical protein